MHSKFQNENKFLMHIGISEISALLGIPITLFVIVTYIIKMIKMMPYNRDELDKKMEDYVQTKDHDVHKTICTASFADIKNELKDMRSEFKERDENYTGLMNKLIDIVAANSIK